MGDTDVDHGLNQRWGQGQRQQRQSRERHGNTEVRGTAWAHPKGLSPQCPHCPCPSPCCPGALSTAQDKGQGLGSGETPLSPWDGEQMARPAPRRLLPSWQVPCAEGHPIPDLWPAGGTLQVPVLDRGSVRSPWKNRRTQSEAQIRVRGPGTPGGSVSSGWLCPLSVHSLSLLCPLPPQSPLSVLSLSLISPCCPPACPPVLGPHRLSMPPAHPGPAPAGPLPVPPP